MASTDLYEKDYYAWAKETAEAIRSGAFNKIDTEALADEVAAIARQERRSLKSRLEILTCHLLKWDFQKENRTRSRAATIAIQRRKTMSLLEDSPSLFPWLTERLPEIYAGAVQLAVKDTNRPEDTFPASCPYTLDEILTTKNVRY